MKRLLSAFLAVHALSSALSADLTRDQAIDALHRVLSPATLKREAIAYLTMEPLNVGDKVVPFGEDKRAFTATAKVWFGYIDDDPAGFFAHRVRYVYIDAVTGKTKVVVQEWWPEVNGEPIFSRDAVKLKPELRIFSTRDRKKEDRPS